MSEEDAFDEEVEEEDEEENEAEKLEQQNLSTDIKIIAVKGVERITPNIMSETEYIAVVCRRADQIKNGAPYYVTHPGICPKVEIVIAEREILTGKCPITIERVTAVDEKKGIKYVELWDVNELIKCRGPNDYSKFIEKNSKVKSFTELADTI